MKPTPCSEHAAERGSSARALRIVIADDHERYRRSLVQVCRIIGHFDVVAVAGDVASALTACTQHAPDLVLVDDVLTGGGGLVLARSIKAMHPACTVVLLSLRSSAERAEKERDPAIARCLSRSIDPMDLVSSLRQTQDRAGGQAGESNQNGLPGDDLAELAARCRLDPHAPVVDAADAASAVLAAIRDRGRHLVLSPASLHALAQSAGASRLGYLLTRVAQALLRRELFDPRLVRLRLLIDRGEQAMQGRWTLESEALPSLESVLGARSEPVFVLLGDGGAGKSTLLRRAATSQALAAVHQAEPATHWPLPYVVNIGDRRPTGGDGGPRQAMRWLSERWTLEHPQQPKLETLLEEGAVCLLLDGLLSGPVRSQAEQEAELSCWARLADHAVTAHPTNRVIFSSRHLHDTEPLSTSTFRVPHVRLEPLDAAQIHGYLHGVAAQATEAIWPHLTASPQLEVLRRPFYLVLFGEQLAHLDIAQIGQATLITAFVRRALERELAHGDRSVLTPPLMLARDIRRLVGGHWSSPWDLPEEGSLVSRLSDLAYVRQSADNPGDEAKALQRPPAGDALTTAVLEAGESIDVLVRETGADTTVFRHQILQEYFAARRLARFPDPERVRLEWRAAAIEPGIRQVLDNLRPGAELPMPASTGWENVVLLAATMTEDPIAFLDDVKAANLTLAGAAAAQPDLRGRLREGWLDALRRDLLQRSRDPETDLRHRIAAGFALGTLGDPRLERHRQPQGDYLLPPFVELSAGRYPIGDDEPIAWETLGNSGTTRDHCPRHQVRLAAFAIGRLPVTNAEWALFMADGGYDEPRWWDTDNARSWLAGDLAMLAHRHTSRSWRREFQVRPALMEQMVADGRFESIEAVARWRTWLQMDDAAFEADLDRTWTPQRANEPAYWRDSRYNNASQPVVGVSWYEARAYCNWLSARSQLPLRLPTEVEWEATARGLAARTFAWGEGLDRLRCNLLATQLLRTVPVGTFPEGDTPEGVGDMHGNVMEWTSSAIRQGTADCQYCYPYDPDDGRECSEGPADLRRVVRGGSWRSFPSVARSAFRDKRLPDSRSPDLGFRLAMNAGPMRRRRRRT